MELTSTVLAYHGWGPGFDSHNLKQTEWQTDSLSLSQNTLTNGKRNFRNFQLDIQKFLPKHRDPESAVTAPFSPHVHFPNGTTEGKRPKPWLLIFRDEEIAE